MPVGLPVGLPELCPKLELILEKRSLALHEWVKTEETGRQATYLLEQHSQLAKLLWHIDIQNMGILYPILNTSLTISASPVLVTPVHEVEAYDRSQDL